MDRRNSCLATLHNYLNLLENTASSFTPDVDELLSYMCDRDILISFSACKVLCATLSMNKVPLYNTLENNNITLAGKKSHCDVNYIVHMCKVCKVLLTRYPEESTSRVVSYIETLIPGDSDENLNEDCLYSVIDVCIFAVSEIATTVPLSLMINIASLCAKSRMTMRASLRSSALRLMSLTMNAYIRALENGVAEDTENDTDDIITRALLFIHW